MQTLIAAPVAQLPEQTIPRTAIVKEIKVFVIMPFGNKSEYRDGTKESDHVFDELIQPSVEQAFAKIGKDYQFVIDREVDKNQAGSITESILNSLVTSEIVIADLTGNNANVFFELGVRFSLRRKVTILLAQPGTVVPFDIQDYRLVKYDPLALNPGRAALANFIIAGMEDRATHDSLVFKTFPKLSVRIPNVLEAVGDALASNLEMSWDEYIGRIEWIGSQLQHALTNGTFAPDALVGISNGGLIVADLLSRNHLRGTPVLSLWANRFKRDTDHHCWYFKNSYNDNLMKALFEGVQKQRHDDPPRILLVDDRVGTGQTAQQAIDYLREMLGDKAQIVFVPLAISRPEYIQTVKGFLPCNYVDQLSNRKVFALSEDNFLERLVTEARRFPYKKSIAESVG